MGKYRVTIVSTIELETDAPEDIRYYGATIPEEFGQTINDKSDMRIEEVI
jgi:hypothetical protein